MVAELTTSDHALRVGLLASVSWGPELPLEVATIGPEPGWGTFEVPGPKRVPSRPWVEPVAGPGGVVARVLRPDGQPRPVAMRIGPRTAFVTLPAPPLSVAARGDTGLWSLDRTGLRHLSSSGETIRRVDRSGTRLVGSTNDSVWVLDLQRCWLVRADGETVGPFPWRDPFAAVACNGGLCRLDVSDGPRLCMLDTEGHQTVQPISAGASPFERLVRVGQETLLTSTVNTLSRYERDGSISALPAGGAGLTTSGQPFFASVVGEHITLWVSDQAARRLPLYPAGLTTGSVIAIEGDSVLVWAGSRAARYTGEALEQVFDVDEERYRNELFPQAWRADRPFPFVAGPDQTVVISAAGPTGVALVAVRWT